MLEVKKWGTVKTIEGIKLHGTGPRKSDTAVVWSENKANQQEEGGELTGRTMSMIVAENKDKKVKNWEVKTTAAPMRRRQGPNASARAAGVKHFNADPASPGSYRPSSARGSLSVACSFLQPEK